MDWQLFMDLAFLLQALSSALLIFSYLLLLPRTLPEMVELSLSGSAIPMKFRKRFIISAGCSIAGIVGLMATLWLVAGYPALFLIAMVMFPFIGLLPERYLVRLRRHEELVTAVFAVVVALVFFWFASP